MNHWESCHRCMTSALEERGRGGRVPPRFTAGKKQFQNSRVLKKPASRCVTFC